MQTNKQIFQIYIKCLKPQLKGGRPVGFLQSTAKELNLGPPRTNPVSSRAEDLNLGPPDYKTRALTTQPCCLHKNLHLSPQNSQLTDHV